MFVCVCNGISDKDLRTSFEQGAKTVPELQMKTGCGTCCGSCLEMLDDLVKEWGPSVPYQPPQEAFSQLPNGGRILAFEACSSTRVDISSMTSIEEARERHQTQAPPKIA